MPKLNSVLKLANTDTDFPNFKKLTLDLLLNLTHISVATDKHGIIGELLEVVICIRFAPKL
jgi:hypothetical protein